MQTPHALGALLSSLLLILVSAPAAIAERPSRSHPMPQTLVNDPTLTDEWAGIWSITATRYDCGSAMPSTTYTEVDTFSAGDVFPYPVDLSPYCQGTIDATSINVTCYDCTELRCSYDISTSVTCTRSGDTFSGNGWLEANYSGGCSTPGHVCYDETYSGVRIGALAAGKNETPAPPLKVAPNPFSSSTTLSFRLSTRSDIRISVIDVQGREVLLLAQTTLDAGPHTLRWDGRDTAGRAAPAGLYFAIMQVDRRITSTQKLLLVH